LANIDGVRQVLTNLIKNAVHVVQSINQAIVIVRCVELADHYEISVIDTAAALKNDDIGRIFEAFSALKNNHTGIGIGLYASKLICAAMGARLNVRLVSGSTIFHVKLSKHKLI
jgi:C4-dicarboxylate-specific signal transduction histidine kinase